MDTKPITLYTAATPNGFKASITLEELGVPYEVRSVDLSKGEQKEAWFLKISPNGKIPAIVDHWHDDVAIFDSGALMLYLVEQYGEGNLMPELMPREPKERSEVLSWLMFHLSDMGPTQGEAAYYVRTEESNPMAQRRLLKETKQMYSVLDKALKGKKFLAGGRFSLADIAHFCWVAFHFHVGISLDDFPNIKEWVYRIYGREAVKRGLNVPVEFKYKELFQDASTMKKWVEAARKRILD
ncbi:hypothetical protein BSKO_02238 [Bryopsis sp. KO-2023]|nr:hypothetical protein BSKO_02238 [Bryopsis sp. KO-2023]